MLRKKI
jgi:hypothetical protein